MKIVIDSWAWFEYFQKTPKGIEAAKYIDEPTIEKITTKVNLFELYIKYLREESKEKAEKSVAWMKELAKIDEMSDETIKTAAQLKHSLKLGMADAIVAATAKANGAKILTGDPDFGEFKAVEVIFLGELRKP